MSSLQHFFDNQLGHDQSEWENALLKELKLSELSAKITSKEVASANWPTLSLEAKTVSHLSSELTWKKASTTYTYISKTTIGACLDDDLRSGVKNFFFHADSLNPEIWEIIQDKLKSEDDVEAFVLGGIFHSDKIKVISNLISGQESHNQGGHSIQELGFLARNLISQLDQKGDFNIGVFVDAQFFQSIAKLRAARLIAIKILDEAKIQKKIRIVALTSYQGWTLFERYSNMLRNQTCIAAGFIGGADHIQSSGYNTLLELESTDPVESEHFLRSQRMARNTSHILALESMLGVVLDAGSGSFHLENLTEFFCQEAWTVMQGLLEGKDFSLEIQKVRDQKLLMLKTRKKIISGINDFPNVKEELNLKLKNPLFFRLARPFEELRLQMESLKKPRVIITYVGDYGALNLRLNFVKNYFELLGLLVEENTNLENYGKKEDIVVLCALDEDYNKFEDFSQKVKSDHKYIAGKIQVSGFKNLMVGQNIYEILKEIVNFCEEKKSHD